MTERAERIRAMLTDIETWNPFCHGTSTRFKEDIEKKGLRPRECDGEVCRPSAYEGKLESMPDRVYVARVQPALGTCIFSAGRAAEKFGGEPVVFGIKLKKEDEERLASDEDADFFIDNSDATGQCRTLLNEAARLDKETLWSSAYADRVPKEVVDEILKEIKKGGAFSEGEVDCVCKGLPRWVLSLITKWTVAKAGEVPPEKLRGPEPIAKLYYGVPGREEAQRRLGA
jgi:hypothetical protein